LHSSSREQSPDYAKAREEYTRDPLTDEEQQYLKQFVKTLSKGKLLKLSVHVIEHSPDRRTLTKRSRVQKRQEFGILQWFKENFAAVAAILATSPYTPQENIFPTVPSLDSLLPPPPTSHASERSSAGADLLPALPADIFFADALTDTDSHTNCCPDGNPEATFYGPGKH
jgi:hypothetical protein